jgi:hypothetical protein
MKRHLPSILLLAAGLHTAVHASAQTVWRCGPDGRSYESQPCKDGRAVELPGARPEADVLAAQQVAAADQRLARQLREERLARERELLARGPGPAGLARAAPAAQVKLAQDRSAKAASKPKAVPVRQARSPEAGGTSPRVARASPRTPG